MSVMIAIPTMSCKIEYRLAGWLYRIREEGEAQGFKPELIFRQAMPIDASRNKLVLDFLQSKHEWLIFVDDDMIPKFKFDQIFKNIGDKKIVSAVAIVMQNGIPGPLIMKRSPLKETSYRRVDEKEMAELPVDESYINVDGVGTGFLMIHREVFEKIPGPWFKFQYKEDGTMGLSEDYYFSERAKEAGYKLWVNCDLMTGHTKYVDLHELNQMLYKIVSAPSVRAQGLGRHADKKEVFENG